MKIRMNKELLDRYLSFMDDVPMDEYEKFHAEMGYSENSGPPEIDDDFMAYAILYHPELAKKIYFEGEDDDQEFNRLLEVFKDWENHWDLSE